MLHEFFSKAQELLDHNKPFVMALVVRAEKPTSGKPGDKALITADGTMYGWIGGSCSQPTVIRESLKALKDGKSRFIRLSPDPQALTPRDGLIDLPITCFSGGTLEIYIEPQYPQPRLLVIGNLPVAQALISLGKVMNYDVVSVDPDSDEDAVTNAAHLVNSLADIGHFMRPDTYVVVATHGSFDEAALEQVLKSNPRYIGLVASHKRFQSVLEYLRLQDISDEELQRIKAPAGLDIQAQQGDEIALSIMAEIVQYRRNATQAANWEIATEPPPSAEHEHAHAHDHSHDATIPLAMAGSTPVASGIAIDPVCHMEVNIATAKYTYDFEGQTYYFCSAGCKRSFSQNPHTYLHPEPVSGVAIDPVCGMEVEIATAQHTAEYHGKTYYFCGAGCKETFEKESANLRDHDAALIMSVLQTLLSDLPTDWRVSDVYVGANWVLSLVRHPDGSQRAGVASAPQQIDPQAQFQIGYSTPHEDATLIARLLLSQDLSAAAVGLATINALNQPDDNAITLADAANWLTEQAKDRSVAIFGRFPFIDEEVRPFARQVWVFEQQPQANELDSSAITTVLPQAELVAITGSTVANHSIDLILPHIKRGSTVVLLGPSTPLSVKLFNCGIDAMFGVRVINLPQVIESVLGGDGFQKIQGLQRVALFKKAN